MDDIIFNDTVLDLYHKSEQCESLHRLYSGIEQPPFPCPTTCTDITDMEIPTETGEAAPQPTVTRKTVRTRPSLPHLQQQQQQDTPTRRRVVVNEPPPAASVFKLFAYFSEGMVTALSLPYADVLETVGDRCPPIVAREVVERRANLESVVRTFVVRLIEELFTVDERGGKIKQILAELDETYLLADPPRRTGPTTTTTTTTTGGGANQQPKRRAVCGGKSNFINVDAVNRSAEKTYQETMSSEDKFFRRCSDAKKRGRRPNDEKNNQPERIDLIKRGHILSQKSVAPITYSEADDKFYTMAASLSETRPRGSGSYGIQSTVDFYPVFMKVLDNFHACIPRPTNHGLYLARLNKAVRLLTPRDWPMHGLVRSLMNMDRVFPLAKVLVPTDGATYRCAYSGLQLRPGEEVWHLRVLVNCGRRHRKWVIELKMPPCPMSAPEFTRSVRAYFIRCSVVGIHSLFYTLLSQPPNKKLAGGGATKTAPPRPLVVRTKSPLPPNRVFSVNTLWLIMNQLRVFIAQEDLALCVFTRFYPQIPYGVLLTQLTEMLCAEVPRDEVMTRFDGCLFIGTLVSDLQYRVDHSLLLTDPCAMEYMKMVRDTVLDFIDLMFPLQDSPRLDAAAPQGENERPHIARHSFSLHRFGVKNDEKTKIPPWVNPTLRDTDSVLLSVLLAESHQRHQARRGAAPTYTERKERMDRLEKILVRHPLIFIALFQVIFSPHTLTPTQRLSFRECNHHLQCMGMYINTDPALQKQMGQ